MIFVTGTDTGCGKTPAGRAILAAARRRGLSVSALKPVETGCAPAGDGGLVPEDALALGRAAGLSAAPAALCPYRLALPASPERAAEEEGVAIELSPIERAFAATRAARDFVLVEGAGGLLVPLGPGLTIADLPRALGLPVLVVARDVLGTVSHALLTVEAVRRRGLTLLGVVLCRVSSAEPGLRNGRAIEAHGGGPLLGTLPFLPGADDEALARAAERHLDLEAILGGGGGPSVSRRGS